MENKDFITNALKFFKEGDYKSSLNEFLAALGENPDDNAILNNIGLCYTKLSDDEKAEEYFTLALKDHSESVETYINLADLYYRQRRLEEGANLLETAVTLMPDNIVLMHYLARIYIADVKYDLAFDILNRILELSPENIDAYWDFGNLSFETGDYESAAAAFEHVLEKRDDNAIFFFRTGQAYEMCDNVDKALSNYLKAIAADRFMAQPYKKAAVMFLAQGDKDGAKEYLEDYLKFDLPDEEKESIKSVIKNISL